MKAAPELLVALKELRKKGACRNHVPLPMIGRLSDTAFAYGLDKQADSWVRFEGNSDSATAGQP